MYEFMRGVLVRLLGQAGHHSAAELEATQPPSVTLPRPALPNQDGRITCERPHSAPRGRYNGVLLQGEVLKLNDAMSLPITRL